MAAFRFGILGAVVAERDGVPVTPRSTTTRAALGLLLLAEGKPLTADRLLTLLNPARPPSSGKAWVHVNMSRLRRWLDQFGDTCTLHHRPDGYVLTVPPDSLDLARFRCAWTTAQRTDDPHERVRLLTGGLRMWRGPVLDDLTDHLGNDGLASACAGMRIDAACLLGQTALASGQPGLAWELLHDLAAQHPLDERLHGVLALVLAADGRQADALQVIERTTVRLAEELGVDPGEHLRAAHLRVLRQQGLTPAAEPVAAMSWAGPRPQLTTLVGRDAESAELAGLVRGNRLVTVLGTGGCGKTTLALHVADQVRGSFPDGVVVVALAPVHTEAALLTALAVPLEASGPDLRAAVLRAVAGRHGLLLLDNCEHVASECAAIIGEIRAVAPELAVLTTSRQPLGVVGEVVWQLDTLDLDGAAQALFVRRAVEALPSFTPDDAEVTRICRRLDGLPLALELAAALVRALPLDQLAARLDRDLGVLDLTVSRQRTLHATVDWSYSLLDEPQRVLLQRLSVFRGGFALSCAEFVCSDAVLAADDVLPLLVSLVDRSLVKPYVTGGRPRYRLLSAVREFAAAHLAAGPLSGDAVRDRLLDRWAGLAGELDALPLLRDRTTLARKWSADMHNVTAALEHGFATRPVPAAEIAARMFVFWMTNRAFMADGARWLDLAIEVECPPEVTALARFQLTRISGLRGDYQVALDELRAIMPALAQSRPRECREAMIAIITNSRFLLDPLAVTDLPPMLEAITDDDSDEPSTALTAGAGVLAYWGRLDEAEELVERYAVRAARRGTPFSISQHVVRAEIAIGRGDWATARRWLDGQLVAANTPLELEPVLRATAVLYLAQDQPQEAKSFLLDAIADLCGRFPPELARDLHLQVLLAEALRRTGAADQARAQLQQSLTRALDRTHYRVNYIAVLVGALLAADAGCPEADGFARRWDAVREQLGLPTPIGFTGVLGERPTAEPGEPATAELIALTHDVLTWCVGQAT